MKFNFNKFVFNFRNFIAIFFLIALLWQLGDVIGDKKRNLAYFPLPEIKPLWEDKINIEQELKIGIMTDNHIRSTRISRLVDAENSPRIIKPEDLMVFSNFNKEMKIFNPDFIVHLGDGIEGTDDPDYVGLSGLNLIKKELEKNKKPVYWVLGNHELRSVSKDQFKNVFNLDSLDYVADWGEYRFIFLDGNYNPENIDNDFGGYEYTPGFIHPEKLIWLEDQLRTNKRVYVFLHQSILNQQYLSENQLAKSPIFNAREVMDLFEKYNVEAFFNGHIESSYYEEVEGVEYYSLPGPKKSPNYQKSYYEMIIENDKVDMKMFYQDSLTGKFIKTDFEDGLNLD